MSAMLFNSLLFFVSCIFYFSVVVIGYRLFGRPFLYAWSALSIVIANIEVLIQVDMFGLHATLGNSIYACSFLVTDLLSELYGKKAAHKAVNIGVFTAVVWVIATQLMTAFMPNDTDFAMSSLKTIFELMPRLALASVFTYAVSQRLDVFLYHLVWKFTAKRWGKRKHMWSRNLTTMVSQTIDSIAFNIIAFAGVFEIPYLISITVVTIVVKMLCVISDTPFLYIMRRVGEKHHGFEVMTEDKGIMSIKEYEKLYK